MSRPTWTRPRKVQQLAQTREAGPSLVESELVGAVGELKSPAVAQEKMSSHKI